MLGGFGGLVVGLGALVGPEVGVVAGGEWCLPGESSAGGWVPSEVVPALPPVPGWPAATAAAHNAAGETFAPTVDGPEMPEPAGAGTPVSPVGDPIPEPERAVATDAALAVSEANPFESVVAANAAMPLTNVAVKVIEAANADRLSIATPPGRRGP